VIEEIVQAAKLVCEDAVEQISTGGAQPGGNLSAAMAHAANVKLTKASSRIGAGTSWK